MTPERAVRAPMQIYLDHLAESRLAYQYSPAAEKVVFYPRILCPYTGSSDLEWRVSSGLGTVYSLTIVSRRGHDDHCVVLVDLDEGFRMMSRVEDVAPRDVKIGMRVKFRVHQPPGEEDPYPVFTPVAGAGQ